MRRTPGEPCSHRGARVGQVGLLVVVAAATLTLSAAPAAGAELFTCPQEIDSWTLDTQLSGVVHHLENGTFSFSCTYNYMLGFGAQWYEAPATASCPIFGWVSGPSGDGGNIVSTTKLALATYTSDSAGHTVHAPSMKNHAQALLAVVEARAAPCPAAEPSTFSAAPPTPSSGSGSGALGSGLIGGVVVLVTAAVGGLIWTRRRTDQNPERQRLRECDELGVRLERMLEKRERLRSQLRQGIPALARANAQKLEMERSYQTLESQHTEALGYLGAAATVSALALGAVAASCAAFAAKAATAVEIMSTGLSGYAELLYGASSQAVAAGVKTLAGQAAQSYAMAAGAATGTSVPPTLVMMIRAKMNDGLTEAQASMSNAERLRQALKQALNSRLRELHELEAEIHMTRMRMRGCPGVEIIPEPPEDFLVPEDATVGSPPRG